MKELTLPRLLASKLYSCLSALMVTVRRGDDVSTANGSGLGLLGVVDQIETPRLVVSGSGVARLKGFRPSVSVLICVGTLPVVKISDLGAVISPDASISVDPPLVPLGVLMRTTSAFTRPGLMSRSPAISSLERLRAHARRLV